MIKQFLELIKQRNISKRLIICLLIAQMIFFLVIGLREAQLLHSLEIKAYDQFVVWKAKQHAIDPRIVLIGINENDFKQWGWPLGDKLLVKLLQELIPLNPKVIGLDLYRERAIPSSYETSIYPEFEVLNRLLRDQSNIIGIENYQVLKSNDIKAPPGLVGSQRVGFNDMIRDKDSIVRRGFIYLHHNKQLHFSFPFKLFEKYTGKQIQTNFKSPDAFLLGKGRIAPFSKKDGGYIKTDDKGFQFLLDYQGGHESFKLYSMTDALSANIPTDSLKNKIVIVGITAKRAKDIFRTTFRSPDTHIQDLQGIELLGHITSQLIRISNGESHSLKIISDPIEWSWIWLASMIGALTAYQFRRLVVLASSSLLELMCLFMLCWIGFVNGWWLPLIPSAIAWFLSASSVYYYLSTQDRHEKEILKQIYSPYLPHEIANFILQNRKKLLDGNRLRPHELTATVLFSDVYNFTSIVNELSPEQLLNWLNSYMQAMITIVTSHDGMVNKMMGDGIMAVFGAPVLRSSKQEIRNDAMNAAFCAIEMGKALETLNQQFRQQGFPQIKIRIGIMTGQLIAGSVGNRDRLEYTVLGDTVNTAARLESYDKTKPDDNDYRILIGDTTLSQLNNLFAAEHVGKVALKGKSEKIDIYRLISSIDENN